MSAGEPPIPTAPRLRSRWGGWVRHWPLVVILVLAAGLRVYRLDACPLWTDELFSLQSTAGRGFWVEDLPRGVVLDPAPNPTSLDDAAGVGRIYFTQSTDTNPPGYYFLLRLWRDGFGSSAWMLRFPSVLASLVTVGAMYVAGLAMGGRRTGSIAAVLTALATGQIVYAHEARPYAMACALVSVAAAAGLLIRQYGVTRLRLATVFLSSALALGTLYLAAIPIAALGVYVLVDLRGKARRQTFLAGAAAVIVALVALAPLLYYQRHALSLRNQWLLSEEPRTLVVVAKDAAVAGFGQLADLQERSYSFAHLAGIALILAAIPLWRFVPTSRLWLLWTAGALGALAVMDLIGNKTHLSHPRYSLLAAPGLIGLLASLSARSSPPAAPPLPPTQVRRYLVAVPLAAVLLCLLSVPSAYEVEKGAKEDWTIVQNYVGRGGAKPGDLWVIVAFGQRRWDHILYLGLSRYLPGTHAIGILDSPDLSTEVLRAGAERRGGLVVFIEAGTQFPPRLVPEGWTLTSSTNFPTVGSLATYRPAPTQGER